MDGDIPCTPEARYCVRVPPVAIEIPVSEPEQFPSEVHQRVEDVVEPQQPEQMVGELQGRSLLMNTVV